MTTDLTLAPFQTQWEDALAELCRTTGAQGNDATGMYVSDDLLGDVYLRPYTRLEPELATVLVGESGIHGYLVATADTASFVARYRAQYLPWFAAKYADVSGEQPHDLRVLSAGRTPEHMLPSADELRTYPAHLHIDLSAAARGGGHGGRLMRNLFHQLAERGVPGVHLRYGPSNLNAAAFYRHLGFTLLAGNEHTGYLVGRAITPADLRGE